MSNKEILGFGVFFGVLSYFSALSAFGEAPRILQFIMCGIFALVAGVMIFGFFRGITEDIKKEGWVPVIVILLVFAFVG